MSKAFLVTCANSQAMTIEQIHVNLWFFSYSKAYLDVGLLIDINKDVVFGKDQLEMNCYTPFSIKNNTLTDLYEKLYDEEILQLVFNDFVDSINNVSSVPSSNIARLLHFRSKRRFVVFKSTLKSDKDNNKLKIVLDTKNILNDVLLKEFEKENSIRIYTRFRYQIDIRNTSNIYFDKRILHNQVHFDLRFNEFRLIEDDNPSIYRELVPIKNVFVFTIQPTYFGILLEPNASRKYVRLLEKERKGWLEYLDAINQEKDNFMVYHWREELSTQSSLPDVHFNMVVSFEAEKVDVTRQLNFALLTALLSSVFLLLPNFIDLTKIAGKLTPFLQVSANTIGSIGLTVGLGLATSAIYDFLKDYFRDKQNRSKKI